MMPSPLKTKIKSRLSKREVDELAAEILAGSVTHKEICALFFETDRVVLFNLFWTLSTVASRSAAALAGLEIPLFYSMLRHANNEAVVRGVLSIYKIVPIPEEVEDELYHFCFQTIEAANSPIAHRSFALIVCVRLCKKFPELSGELLSVTKIIDETYGETSPGVRSACRQVFRHLTPR